MNKTDKLFDLKYQLTDEHLRNGGLEGIKSTSLVEDLLNFDRYNEATHTSRIKAFMNLVLGINQTPPIVTSELMGEYRSFIQKDIFFEQIKIDTEQQVDELFKKFEDSDDYIFRGQREACWRLYNTIQRTWVLNGHEETCEFADVLKKMVEVGKERHQEEIQKVVGKDHMDTLNDLAILGFLQHHGCNTPLLDWTSSFLNAMFFATDGVDPNTAVKEIKDYISLYFLNKKDIEPGGYGCMIDNALKEVGKELKSIDIALVAKDEAQRIEMEEHFKDRDFFDRSRIEGSGLISHNCSLDNILGFPSGIVYFSENVELDGIVFSLLNSENIKSQKGAFIFNTHPYKPVEVLAHEEYAKDNDGYKFCECYNINKKLVPYIQKKLEDLEIKTDVIYPDEGINTSDIFSVALEDTKKEKGST